MTLKRSIFFVGVFLLCFNIPSFSIARGSDIDSNPLFKIAGITKQGYSLGYIDKSGKVIIPLKYREANDFSEDLAVVMTHDLTKYGYIDKTGKMVIKQQFNNGAMAFSEGLAAVGINGKWGYIDKSGNIVIKLPPVRQAVSFSEGLAPILTKDKGWGYIDKTGGFVIQPQYVHAERFKNGLAHVSTGNLKGSGMDRDAYIDKTGKEVWSRKF